MLGHIAELAREEAHYTLHVSIKQFCSVRMCNGHHLREVNNGDLIFIVHL